MAGREIKEITIGVARFDKMESVWHVDDLAAGTYLVRIDVDGASVTRTAVLLPERSCYGASC